MNRTCIVRDLGRMSYREALSIQESIAGERKLGRGADHLLFVEHSHVITIGRNGRESNVLASPALLGEKGVAVYESDRGGDVTYHGPGQIVAYPIVWEAATRFGVLSANMAALVLAALPLSAQAHGGFGIGINLEP